MSEAMTEPNVIPLKGLRGMIARNMSQGWEAPRVSMSIDIDMTKAQALRVKLNEQEQGRVKVSLTPIILSALAQVLRNHRGLNAFVETDRVVQPANINIGLAVAIPDGLSVPVIKDTDKKTIVEIAVESAELAAGARNGKLPIKAYQGGTFTVSNLGMTNISWFTPILNPPQAAILGVSATIEKPVVLDGKVDVRPIATYTLVFDHRAVDGFPAAQFLGDFKSLMESCESLV